MRHSKNHIVNKICNLIFSILGFILLSVFTFVLYFLIIISTEYKSFPFITQTIETKLNDKFGDSRSIKVKKSYIKFSHFYKIQARLSDIELNTIDQENLILPEIEMEFSIFNLLLAKTTPSKIRIIGAEIEIDNRDEALKPKVIIRNPKDNKILSPTQDYSKNLLDLFALIKSGTLPIESFEIIDTNLIFNIGDSKERILLKYSQINTQLLRESLKISTKNKISFSDKMLDLEVDAKCTFEKVSGLKCDMGFFNFIPRTISRLHKKLLPLGKINSRFAGNLNIEVNKKYQISNLLFNINSVQGSFEYPEFFSKKMDFTNLAISGEFDNLNKILRISNLGINFDNTKFNMSLEALDFLDPNKQKTTMEFNINNAPINDLEKLWPVFLNKAGVRKWVTTHLSNGKIKDGYAKAHFQHQKGKQYLHKIDSKVAFSDTDLNYSNDFPSIDHIDGVANFTRKGMDINLTSGNLLKSKVNLAKVEIKNFHKNILLISGEIAGNATDSLKHINYKGEFAKKVDNYFNGKAKTIFDIKLPLGNDLSLKNSYINVVSDISDFNNNYLINNSNISIQTTKNSGEINFDTKINLTDAHLKLDKFGIHKNKSIESQIKTNLLINNDNINLENFSWKQGNSKLNGNLTLKKHNLDLLEINLNSQNFGHNNFAINYLINNNSRKLKLSGKSLDLKYIFNQEFRSEKGNKKINDNDIKIHIDKIYLANNETLENVDIKIDCKKALCDKSFIKANLLSNKDINLSISKKTSENYSEIKGYIKDISYVAKAFNISNKIIGGKAKIEGKLQPAEKGRELIGEISIDSGFTILKNEVVEKISNENAFSNIKNHIDSQDKIRFDNLLLNFRADNRGIYIKKLIADSKLMGFTSKGNINLENGAINLKGVIVPGYVLNKLFGIGKVPILGKIIVGEEGGGIFAIRYDYIRIKNNKDGNFSINPVSAIIPGGIRNIFDIF